MFLDFGIVVNAILLVLGILWCREMFGRLPKDLEEYRTAQDPSVRQTLMILWIATGLIVLLLVNFLVGILGNVGLFGG